MTCSVDLLNFFRFYRSMRWISTYEYISKVEHSIIFSQDFVPPTKTHRHFLTIYFHKHQPTIYALALFHLEPHSYQIVNFTKKGQHINNNKNDKNNDKNNNIIIIIILIIIRRRTIIIIIKETRNTKPS